MPPLPIGNSWERILTLFKVVNIAVVPTMPHISTGSPILLLLLQKAAGELWRLTTSAHTYKNLIPVQAASEAAGPLLKP